MTDNEKMIRHEFVKEVTYIFKCQKCCHIWSEFFQKHWKITCPNCGNNAGADEVRNIGCWK